MLSDHDDVGVRCWLIMFMFVGVRVCAHVCVQVVEVSDRLVQLQRCMRSLSNSGSTGQLRGQGSESESLSAILALMASILLECDLHCHSNRLQEVAQKLGLLNNLFLICRLSLLPSQTTLTF